VEQIYALVGSSKQIVGHWLLSCKFVQEQSKCGDAELYLGFHFQSLI